MQTLRLFIPGIILIGIILLLYEDPKMAIVEDFKENPQLLDNLKASALKDSTLLAQIGASIRFEAVGKRTKEALDKLGLDSVQFIRLRKADCGHGYTLDLEFDDEDGLSFDPCPTTAGVPGRHYLDDSTLIEIWELDEYWTYWKNIDFIG